MSLYINLLYDYFVGYPDPERWPEELRDNPVAGHSRYAFAEGFRLGSCSCWRARPGSYCGPRLPSFQCLRHRPM